MYMISRSIMLTDWTSLKHCTFAVGLSCGEVSSVRSAGLGLGLELYVGQCKKTDSVDRQY